MTPRTVAIAASGRNGVSGAGNAILRAMISLYDILEAADGQLFGEPSVQIFTDFAHDVAHVVEGCLFVALRTEHGDGHLHMQAAVERGAMGVVCTQPPDFDTDAITVVIVRNVEQALMNWARIVMDKFGTTVIAVAGTTGKSTTRTAIAAVLGTRYSVYTSDRQYHGRLGLPLALGKLSADHQLAVLELETDLPGEMAELVDIAQPLVGVITNVGHSHIDQLGSLDRITAEMTTLFAQLPEGGLAVLNYDDQRVRGMAEHTAASVFSIGIDSFESDLLAYNVVLSRYKTGFDLRYGADRLVGRWVPLLGRHQVYTALAALAIGLGYQISLEDGLRALTQLEPLPGRMRLLNGINGCLLVDDTFSANPLATQAALDWLAEVQAEDGRLIFVMGDLDHLGHYAQRAHRQLGEQIVQVADLLVTQGNLAAIAGRAALDYGLARAQVRMTYSYHDTCRVLRDYIQPQDIVLVKGSRAQGMGEVVRLLLHDPADDRLLEPVLRENQAVTRQPTRTSWVEVDLGAAASNMRTLCQLMGPEVAVMAMVPADAYGHGAVAVGTTALLNGAAYLGVNSLEEAISLRDAGIDAPILVMGYMAPWAMRDAIRYNVTVVLADLDTARAGNRLAAEINQPLSVHVNIDSGTGRMGLLPEQVNGFFRALRNLKHVRLEGIFTELAAPVDDPTYTREQLDLFEQQFKPILASGIPVPYIHAADSAALLQRPESRYTMVRAGAILHGLTSHERVPLPQGFRPTLRWKTTIAQIKTLPRGSYVGSGKHYRTPREERIAVLPVGYADGFRATPHNWREVLVHGSRVPVVGRVGMRQATINITSVPAAQVGDEVTLIGDQRRDAITVEEVAGWLDTRVFEVLSAILPRTIRR
jgi:alanine racemase